MGFLLIVNSFAPVFVWIDDTEKIKNCQDLNSAGCERKKLVVDYYFEKVRKLKFSCVQLSVTRLLELKQGKPAGKGTIMVEISAEEIKDTRVVHLEIEAQNLDKKVEYECLHPEKKQNKNNYRNSGIIRIKSCKIETGYSFLDYVMGDQINFMQQAVFLHLGLELRFLLAGRDPRNSGCLLPDSASDATLRANQLLSYYKPHGKVCSTLAARRNYCKNIGSAQ
ncbi:copine-1 isoform X2 [Vidua chalybeata]|uniref:copine-1 isoform X2 n=1 Tax=Vidua chalybeata TaxID=81927 RepID=UPI0023A88054|nr:copine-1 isoform X2 [Vidua chalybeata]